MQEHRGARVTRTYSFRVASNPRVFADYDSRLDVSDASRRDACKPDDKVSISRRHKLP